MNIDFSNIENLFKSLNGKGDLQIHNLYWIEPVGIALLKLYKTTHPNINISLNGDSRSVAYVKTLLNPQAPRDRSYLPLEHFDEKLGNIDSVAGQVTSKIVITANELSDEDKKDLIDYLKYLISEMMDNVISHACSDVGGFVTAQYFPTKKKVQVVIIDNGVGLLKTLSSKYTLHNEQEAILKAMEKEVSGSNTFAPYSHVPKHAGLGLYFLSQIIKHTRGKLLIVSNDTIYRFPQDTSSIVRTAFNGTMIAFELYNSELDYEFGQLFNIIKNEGEDEAEDIF
jgi:hypothetical protein